LREEDHRGGVLVSFVPVASLLVLLEWGTVSQVRESVAEGLRKENAMGLFDKLRGSSTVTFNPQQALMTIVVAAVKADGHVSDDEIRRIRSLCLLNPLFSTNSTEQDNAVLRFADNTTHQLGEQAVALAAAALPPALRETAFAYACDMVLADGVVTTDEEHTIVDLAEKLGVSQELAHAIVTTTLVRNRGNE
jgi:uncharacterized tellurite resistance protein B-like protein